MSRLSNTERIEIWDDGIDKILPFKSSKKEERVVLADFDSLIYWTLYETEEDGSRKELNESHLEYLYGKLDELVIKILTKIESYFSIKELFIFIRGDTNFRYELFPQYKANRPPKHFLTDRLYSYMEARFKAIKSLNCESEDMCYSFAKKLNWDCIILYCDHDIEEIPYATLYNYQKDTWKILDESTARMNKISKLILGEPNDGVNLSKGLGKRHMEKFYNKNMTEEEIETQLLISYTKVWKTEELAREKLELAKQLLYLKDIN